MIEQMSGAAFKARVQDELWTEYPRDLYIPPNALEVFLEQFEGPLDLLLYLIKRDRINILDVPICQITTQYVSYIAQLDRTRFELAAEYLLMASILIDIKTRMLLPVLPTVNEAGELEELDPRVELMRRLEAYARFKAAAEALDARPRLGRDFFPVLPGHTPFEQFVALPQPQLHDLSLAMNRLLKRQVLGTAHVIEGLPWSVREQMDWIQTLLKQGRPFHFSELIVGIYGRIGCVIALIAVLDLCRSIRMTLEQAEPFGPIWLQKTWIEKNSSEHLEELVYT